MKKFTYLIHIPLSNNISDTSLKDFVLIDEPVCVLKLNNFEKSHLDFLNNLISEYNKFGSDLRIVNLFSQQFKKIIEEKSLIDLEKENLFNSSFNTNSFLGEKIEMDLEPVSYSDFINEVKNNSEHIEQIIYFAPKDNEVFELKTYIYQSQDYLDIENQLKDWRKFYYNYSPLFSVELFHRFENKKLTYQDKKIIRKFIQRLNSVIEKENNEDNINNDDYGDCNYSTSFSVCFYINGEIKQIENENIFNFLEQFEKIEEDWFFLCETSFSDDFAVYEWRYYDIKIICKSFFDKKNQS